MKFYLETNMGSLETLKVVPEVSFGEAQKESTPE